MAEWILALLQEHSMCSNISKAACSRPSKVPAWTHSDLTASIRDSVTALSWQQPVRPTESLTSLASAQLARSLEVYWPPLSEQSSPYANFRDTRLSDCEAGFPDLEEVAFLPDTERDGHGRPFNGTMSSRILEPRDYGPFDFPNHCPKCSGEVTIAREAIYPTATCDDCGEIVKRQN